MTVDMITQLGNGMNAIPTDPNNSEAPVILAEPGMKTIAAFAVVNDVLDAKALMKNTVTRPPASKDAKTIPHT